MPNWTLVGAILLPNAGGWASTVAMMRRAWYQDVKKPDWKPPRWVFRPAWTIIYTSMGYASYMVYKDCGGFTKKAALPLALYGGQLALNWGWTPMFFGMRMIGGALAHILVLDVAATACTISFARINKKTLYCMVPYLCWLSFASYLTYTIWKLNKPGKDVTGSDNE
ncbi:translocator protein-like [Pectinophora gossypiella]|uniref:translocator protein-like n=1 Tax=Pectinophora gossypiella TaxID=13191 RepID=UPI00214E4B31|nr:translocator protein-like [Pectinophora gossypiella]XP_049880896.1 translocator protein-like [Pectinophora gossypiella]XP_049880897.1 translocator protein-like [Pectinophora gossypiella]XP_049880898.1 translocator protein-like [Pectinophora gossypiella]XP_049880899.1 translocator protein-like [Pectinophora gossypiella]XP_049880900.1 translocator protein-like [Pectinophora gossypiella]XP_049880901.1 translocator protein-like [Pectinophora gossypiella]XP_049880902.1 translocator protein-lik